MKSKKSFFSIAIIQQNFRQHGWIGIIYLLCLLFAIPLEILQIASSDYVIYKDFANYFYFNTELQALFLFTIPIAAGLLLYRYMHTESSVDMIHSLPIRREKIFFNHFMSGLLLLFIPVIITALTTYFATATVERFDSILTISELLSWTIIYLILTSLLFSITVVIGMMTGMSSAHAILTYIALFLPVGLVTVIIYNLSFLLYGFSTAFIEKKIEYLSIFHQFIHLNLQEEIAVPFSLLETTIYLILTIVFFICGILLYKARHLERATDVIVFPILKPLFKYGVTFCSMLLGGSYFSSTTSNDWGWITFGYISAGLLGYVIAEMILQKTWRIFHYRSFIGFIGYSIIMLFILVSIRNDVFQYEKKLPDMDQISEVYIGDKYEISNLNDYDSFPLIYSDSKMYIQDVRNLHEYLIAEKDMLSESKYDEYVHAQEMVITYRLKDGNSFTREYFVPFHLLKDQLKPIIESKEYKMNLPEYKQLQKKLRSITFTPYDPFGKPFTITDETELKELIEILNEELLSQTIDDLISSTGRWGYFDIHYENSETPYYTAAIDWKRSFKRIDEWIAKKEHIKHAHVQPQHIEKAEITRVKNHQEIDVYSLEEFFHQGEEIHTITAQESIDKLLEYSIDYDVDGQYYIKFTLANNTYWYVTVEDKYISDEIKALFK